MLNAAIFSCISAPREKKQVQEGESPGRAAIYLNISFLSLDVVLYTISAKLCRRSASKEKASSSSSSAQTERHIAHMASGEAPPLSRLCLLLLLFLLLSSSHCSSSGSHHDSQPPSEEEEEDEGDGGEDVEEGRRASGLALTEEGQRIRRGRREGDRHG